MDTLRMDAILMEILQERKSITGFLDAIFGFLRRNTDFYHIKKEATENVGFEKGVRERIVFMALQRYDPECKLNNLASEDDCPPAVQEIEIETETPRVKEEMKSKTPAASRTPQISKSVGSGHTSRGVFVPADYKNGAMHEKYCWSQTLRDVELHVKLPANLQSAKSLKIEIKPDSITVRNRQCPEEVVITGVLSNKYKHNDAVWTIAEGKLLLSFDKTKEVWWEKLFTNEKTIDLKKLDCERYIDELPEESQAAIQKLRIQQLKQDNESEHDITEQNSETMERLRKAWDAEGSPFRGQPFDPSVVKFS